MPLSEWMRESVWRLALTALRDDVGCVVSTMTEATVANTVYNAAPLMQASSRNGPNLRAGDKATY